MVSSRSSSVRKSVEHMLARRPRLLLSALFAFLALCQFTASAESEIDSIIRQSAMPADRVEFYSKGSAKEAAFPRLPTSVRLRHFGSMDEDFLGVVNSTFELIASNTGVKLVRSDQDFDFGIVGLSSFSKKLRDIGPSVLTELGVPQFMANYLAENSSLPGPSQCQLQVDYTKEGFIRPVLLLIDTSAEIPPLFRLRCMTSALIGAFGLRRSAQENTSPISQLLALKKIYGRVVDSPFRDLTLQSFDIREK